MADKRPKMPNDGMKKLVMTVRLGGHKIKVFRFKGLMSIHESYGMWLYAQKEIYIDDSLDKDDFEETLIHEMSHAVSDMFDLNFSEHVVKILGVGLHQMLQPYLKIEEK